MSDKGIHTVTLPVSGRAVSFSEPRVGHVKKMLGATPVLAVGMKAGEDSIRSKLISAEDPMDIFTRTCALICELSVDPKFTGEDPAPEGTESLDDLHLRDYKFLSDAVTESAGLEKAKTEADPT